MKKQLNKRIDWEGGRAPHAVWARWALALFVALSLSLSACTDSDDDEDEEEETAEGSEVSMSSTVGTEVTNRYELSIPDGVEELEIRIPARDGAVMMEAEFEGGVTSCGRQGNSELSCEREDLDEGVWEINVTHADDDDNDIGYELIAEAQPEDLDLELEIVDSHRGFYGMASALTPDGVIAERFAQSREHLDILAGALKRAAGKTAGTASYRLDEDGSEIGRVTLIVADREEGREVRLYAVREDAERQLMATEAAAPIVLNGQGDVVQGRLWNFAAGGFSEIRVGDETGTQADIQLLSQPGPLVEERRLESMETELEWQQR